MVVLSIPGVQMDPFWRAYVSKGLVQPPPWRNISFTTSHPCAGQAQLERSGTGLSKVPGVFFLEKLISKVGEISPVIEAKYHPIHPSYQKLCLGHLHIGLISCNSRAQITSNDLCLSVGFIPFISIGWEHTLYPKNSQQVFWFLQKSVMKVFFGGKWKLVLDAFFVSEMVGIFCCEF